MSPDIVIDKNPEKHVWVKYNPAIYFVIAIIAIVNIFFFNKYVWIADGIIIYTIFDLIQKISLIKNIQIIVKASGRVFTNESFKITFLLSSKNPVKITIAPPLLVNKEARTIDLQPDKEEEVVYYSILGTRGLKKFGSYSLKIEGFAKLFTVVRNEEIDSDIKVLPNMEEANAFLERILETIPVIKSKHKLAEDISYIKDIRDYNNEPLNRIHWKNSAKYDRLMVKDYEYAGTSKIYILLDLNLPGGIYSKKAWLYIRKKYEEDAIKATTGLINYFYQKHEQVNLFISHKDGFTKVTEKDHVVYYDYLSEVTGTIENTKDTSDLLEEIIQRVQPVDTVIIISMFLTKEEVKEILKLKSRCGRVVVLLMPYGYRESKSKKYKTYYEVPPEVRELYNYARVLRDENVLIQIWNENVSLMEGLTTIMQE